MENVRRSERQGGGRDKGLPREVYSSRVSDDACAEPTYLPVPAMCQVSEWPVCAMNEVLRWRHFVYVCVPRASSLKRRCQLDKRTNPHPKGVGDSSRPVGSAR